MVLTSELVTEARPKWVGSSVRRKEDPRLLMGQAAFVDDITLPGIMFVAFHRSNYAHARIKQIDVSTAKSLPGVMGVFTAADGVKLMRSWMKYPTLREVPRYSLAKDKVRYVGDPVAAVVATDRYIAEDAAELINLEYEPLPPVTDPERALEAGAPLLYDEWGDNILMHKHFEQGNVERAFSEADLIIKERLRSHRYTATPIEARGVVAHYEPASGALTVWASTQFPHVLRTYLAQTLEFPEHRIRTIAPNVGGGFGPKSNVHADEVAVCHIALRLGRPVKWIETRMEHMLACAHEREQVHHVEAAFRQDGTLLAVKDKAIGDYGVYGAFWTESQPAMLTVTALPGPYRLRNYAYDLYCVVTNKAPHGAHRGFGRPVGAFIIERVMDLAARRLGIDPSEIRLKNMVQPEDMPYTAVTGVIYDSGNYPEALHRALKFAQYDKLRQEQAKLRTHGRYIGIGLGMYVEYTAPNSERLHKALGWEVGGYDSATIRVDPTGKVTVFTGVMSQGQSHETIFSQIVADELGVDIDDIVVIEGDTDLCPYGFGTWASRSTVTAGGACIAAARRIREKVSLIAAHLLGSRPEEIKIEPGRISLIGSSGKSLSLREVADVAIRSPYLLPEGMEAGLEVTVRYEPEVPTTCSYAVHIPVVEVDPETGSIRFLRYYIFDDSGRIINPMTVYGQIHGATAHGIGGTIYEDLPYDESGQLLATTFMDYLVPTSMEIPNMEIEHMETPSLTLGGFKGMGEGGSIPTPGAICNAVEDALSPFHVKITETPLSPERIFKLLDRTNL